MPHASALSTVPQLLRALPPPEMFQPQKCDTPDGQSEIENANYVSLRTERTFDGTRYKYSCLLCKYEKFTKSAVGSHIRKKHLKCSPFACSCGYSTQSTDAFRQHSKSCGRLLFECSQCPFKTITQWRLKRHILKHGVASFRCHLCQADFKFPSNMQRHLKTHLV